MCPSNLAAALDRVGEFAVDRAEEVDLGIGVDALGRVALLGLSPLDEGVGVGVDVPGALRPVGADQEVDGGTGGSPLGEGGATLELDVVGMGADREGAARDGEIDSHLRILPGRVARGRQGRRRRAPATARR